MGMGDLERREGPPGVVPRQRFILLFLLISSEVMSLELAYTFAPYMVESFHVVSNDSVGYYAGLIGAAFGATRLLGTPLWGRLADRVGRAPILIVGALGNLLSMVLFGFSGSVGSAIAFRAIQGGASGNFAVVRAILSDMGSYYEDAVMGKAWSLFGMSWGLGRAITGLIGGYLSQPCGKHPGEFGAPSSDELLCKHPFLLPCLAGAAYMVLVMAGVLLLPAESKHLPVLARKQAGQREAAGEAAGPASSYSGSSTTRLCTTTTAVLVVVNFTFWCFTASMFDDVFSIWTMGGEGTGGLHFTTNEIGAYFGVLGVVSILVNTTVVPWLMGRMPALSFFRWSAFFNAPTVVLFPLCHLLMEQGRGWMWAGLVAFTLLSQVPRNGLGLTLGVIINQSVDPSVAGSLNGILEGVAALAKIVGPALGGALIAWSNENGLSFPFDNAFLFILIAAMSLLIFTLTVVFKGLLSPGGAGGEGAGAGGKESSRGGGDGGEGGGTYQAPLLQTEMSNSSLSDRGRDWGR